MFGFKIPLAKAEITDGDMLAVQECLQSGIVSNGPQIEAFENEFAEFVGAKHAIAVSSGTAALHLSLLANGVSEGSEVVTSPFSFIASANAIRTCGAKPVFCEIDQHSLNIDPSKLEACITPRTKAILPVDIFGLPHDPLIEEIAKAHNLPVIADACEALGATVHGQRVGNIGGVSASCFGFYANKQLTTGEGGMITTNDTRVDGLCRSLRNHGRGADASWLQHERFGFNYRTTEMSAALGRSQLSRMKQTIQTRIELAESYNSEMKPLKDDLAPLPAFEAFTRSWFVFPIICREPEWRELLVQGLADRGIQAGRYFSPPIHLQDCYRAEYGFKGGEFAIAESVSERILSVPFFPGMSYDNVKTVVSTLSSILEGIQTSRTAMGTPRN